MSPFETSYTDALIAITAILTIFGFITFVSVKTINLLRDWLVGRRQSDGSEKLYKRFEQYEIRQEQLQKRIQNLETIIVDADLGNPELQAQTRQEQLTGREAKESERQLKNKLRS